MRIEGRVRVKARRVGGTHIKILKILKNIGLSSYIFCGGLGIEIMGE